MQKKTIVGFGDSLTFGYGVDKSITYTYRLEHNLPAFYPQFCWNIINSGINGDTTREGLERIKIDVLDYHPDIVMILFGSNDSSFTEYQFRTQYEYKKNLCDMIEKLLDSRTEKVQTMPFLITPPPVVDTDFYPFTTTERVKSYGDIMKKVANKYCCPVIDFFSVLIAKDKDDLASYFQFDGLHLSNKGYDCLYDCVFSAIKEILACKTI